MTRRLVYVVGIPGSGKSTMVRTALAQLGWTQLQQPSRFCPHTLLLSYPEARTVIEGAQLGVDRDGFPGTDTLSMSIQPKAVQWLDAVPVGLVVGEGDRLGNLRFLDAAAASRLVTVVYLDTPLALASARRSARAITLGTRAQNPAWVTGRVTKVRRLVEGWKGDRVHVPGDLGREATAAYLTAILGSTHA